MSSLLTYSPTHLLTFLILKGEVVMSMNSLRGAVEWALMVALVFGAGAVAQAQNDEASRTASVVQIGRADGDQAEAELAAAR